VRDQPAKRPDLGPQKKSAATSAPNVRAEMSVTISDGTTRGIPCCFQNRGDANLLGEVFRTRGSHDAARRLPLRARRRAFAAASLLARIVELSQAKRCAATKSRQAPG
jgi:hypothetical protein